jgi:hypothetical protein
MLITQEDLYNCKYDYDTLKTNIYAVSLLDILKSQILSAEFCIKYILKENYQLLEEEKTINIDMVKKYQPHLQDIDLLSNAIRVTNKKIKDQRVDSVEDFESYMNRYP